MGKDFVDGVHCLTLGVLGERDFRFAHSVQHLARNFDMLGEPPLRHQQAQRSQTAGTGYEFVFVGFSRPSDSEVLNEPCASMPSASCEVPTAPSMRRTLTVLGTSEPPQAGG
ncbi:hypothetical protein [Rhizobium laguerreae]